MRWYWLALWLANLLISVSGMMTGYYLLTAGSFIMATFCLACAVEAE